jgi:hypothetical protein
MGLCTKLANVSLKYKRVPRAAGDGSEAEVSVSSPLAYLVIFLKECRFLYIELRQYTALIKKIYKNKLRGFSPQVNYTDRETAACRRS